MKRLLLALLLVLMLAIPAFAESIAVSWNYQAGMENVTGFRLYMSTESGMYTKDDIVATVSYDTGVTEYTADETIVGVPGQVTTYYFVCTAYNDAQESDYSNEVSYAVFGPPKDLRFTVTLPN